MEKGESVKVDCNVEPIRYLMYTTNQVADFFASRGHDGNTNTEKIGELPYIYNTAHGPTTKNFYSDVLLEFPTKSDINDLRGIRDAAFTYSIRATAAMLLRFACESGILNEFTDTNLFHGVINYITEDQYPTNVYSDTVKLLGYFYEFQAKNKVVTGRNNAMSQKVFSIENTANVDMHASNTVNFKPGFHAVSGIRKIDNEKINDRSTYLHGYISPPNYCCNANVNTIERSTNLNKQSEEKIQTNPVLKIDLNEKPTLPNGVKYEEKSSSSEFTIAAYPNPLSKETRIEYKVPTKCKLKIIITNAKGEEIKKIVSESNHEKGIYEVDWNVEKKKVEYIIVY
ncbi:MAG: hypothetical protein IPP65_02300 [Chlorobi bacterium]|nr:hypothetical protein [Chlorobiota bacterium]